jgi:hypothetical protein
MIPAALHELIEWELDIAYNAGYQAGLTAAGPIVDHAIAEACQGATPTAIDVVRRLVATWDRRR